MNDTRKKIVSLRLSIADRQKVKIVADRLGVAESDVFRFAIARALDRLAPLHDENATAEELLGIFLDFGPELTGYFNVDPQRLERLLTDHADISDKMEPGDVEMLALGNAAGAGVATPPDEALNNSASSSLGGETMRQYFYAKYIRPIDDRPLDG